MLTTTMAMEGLEDIVNNYRTNSNIRDLFHELVENLNDNFKRSGCCIKGSLSDNTYSTLKSFPDVDIASSGNFTAEEESYVEIVYSGRPSVYFIQVADMDKAKLIELEIKNKSPTKHSVQPFWQEDQNGGIFLSPKAVRDMSQEWGEWACLPMEPSITGAASSVKLDRPRLKGFIDLINRRNPELGWALSEHILSIMEEFVIEVDITAKFHSSYCKIPPQAKNWEVQSTTGWPDEALIRKIKDAGVRFAPKVNKVSGHLDKDFRMDFAQDILMQDYTHYQKVLVILKDLAEMYIKPYVKDFKSFYFKAAMAWERQKAGAIEPPAHIMLVNTLDHLLEAFKKKVLKDYFEPGLNLLAVMEKAQSEIAAVKLQEVKLHLASYMSSMAKKSMVASKYWGKVLEVMYRAPLDDHELIGVNMKRYYLNSMKNFRQPETIAQMWTAIRDLVRAIKRKQVTYDR